MNKTNPETPAIKPIRVTLETPIVRGDQRVEAVELRKPNAGDLRGVSALKVVELDVNALQVLLPRITSPALTSHDVAQLELPDLMAIGTEVVGFFFNQATRAEVSQTA